MQELKTALVKNQQTSIDGNEFVPTNSDDCEFSTIVSNRKATKRILWNKKEVGYGVIRSYFLEPNRPVFVDLNYKGNQFTIRPIDAFTKTESGSETVYAFIKWNNKKVDCDGHIPVRPTFRQRTGMFIRSLVPKSSVELRIIVGFTSQVASVFEDSETAAAAYANDCVGALQLALDNSQLSHISIVLEKAVLTNYNGGDNGRDDLTELKKPQGALKTLHDQRNGAEIVALANAPMHAHGKTDGCFFVWDYRRDMEATFQHECGHVLGGCHDSHYSCPGGAKCKGLCVEPSVHYHPRPAAGQEENKWRSLMSIKTCGDRKNLFIHRNLSVDGFAVNTTQDVSGCIKQQANYLDRLCRKR